MVFFQGLSQEEALDCVRRLGFAPDKQESIAESVVKLYNLFMEKDATMLEINPFAEDSQGSCNILLFFIHSSSSSESSIHSKTFAWTPKSDSMIMLSLDKMKSSNRETLPKKKPAK